jgi:serine protease AprX
MPIYAVSLSQTAPGKYLIKLTDKNNNPYSLDRPEEFLSERAIQRRAKQNIPLSFNDLPVTPAYIDSLIALGASIYNKSKWFNAVTINNADEELLEKIEELPFVDQSSLKKTSGLFSDKKAYPYQEKLTFFNMVPYEYGKSLVHIRIHNGHLLHQQGYTGEGMQIAIIDAGFYGVDVLPAFTDLWSTNRILGTRDFVDRKSDIYGESTHGMAVLSLIGGNIPYQLVGSAPDADFWLLRSEDVHSEYLVEEDNWISAAEFADSVGADIINTSLGYSEFDDPSLDHTYADMDGNTVRISVAADIAASKGMLVVISAGNQGDDPWGYITAPSDADSVLAVGAVDTSGIIAGFSSRGPSSDGRIKPDVCAIGSGNYYQRYDGTVGVHGGTSFAAPLISGLAACLWQANPEATNMEIYSAIRQSAHMYLNPDTIYGYGIPDFNLANVICGNIRDSIRYKLQPLNAFPNPFTDNVNIGFYSNISGMSIISLFDVTGKKIKEKEYFISDNVNFVNWNDMSDLSSGIYIVKIRCGDSFLIQKIVKK